MMHPRTLSPNTDFKNPCLKASGDFMRSFEEELPVLLVCNRCFTFLRHNRVLVDWLCCMSGERIRA